MHNTSRFRPRHAVWITTAAVALLISGCGGNAEPNIVATPTSATPVAATSSTRANADDLMAVSDGQGGVRSVKASADAYVQPAAAEEKKSPVNLQRRSFKPSVTPIDLGTVNPEKSLQLRKDQTKRGAGKAMQVGFPREVARARDSQSTAQLLQWSATPSGGQIAALAFKSGSAEGMRIGVVVQTLAPQAIVRFYPSGGSKAVEVAGKDINEALALNLASGDTSEEGRTYWGPFLKGETGVFEIELPAGISTASTLIAIPRISHFFLDPLGKESLTGGLQKDDVITGGAAKAAASCNLDVSCNTPLSTASKAVASMDIVKNAASYVCTGTLLNDADSTGTPYFLTADHCIATQTVASTLDTYWFYRSSACNNGLLNPGYQLRTGGAVLLFRRTAVSNTSSSQPVSTDTSFLRLNAAPPAGAVFSGWSAARQSVYNGTNYTGLHNPDGDLQKYSIGQITGYSYIDNFDFAYTSPIDSARGMYRVTWSQGITEPGSSGSGLFLDANSTNPKIVGQLWGGSSVCTAPTSPDFYGRFDLAFQDSLAQWLSPYSQAVTRFYNTGSGSHFYTVSSSEVQSILQYYPGFRFEGQAYLASPVAATGLSPVFRFRNKVNGSYLWTISQSERVAINLNYSNTFIEEGVAWHARQSGAAGFVPLYRFRNFTNGTYFYTASESEKNSVLSVYSGTFIFEGIAYYVKTS